MTIHRQRRVAGGYGWYYLGFLIAAIGLVAVAYVLVTDSSQLELRPWRPVAYLVTIGVVAAVIRARASRRR